MAEQSQQNVVEQPQSVDALSSVDVSVTKSTDPAARAAVETAQATAEESSTAARSAPQDKNGDTDAASSIAGSEGPTTHSTNADFPQAAETNGVVGDTQDAGILEDGSIGTGADAGSGPDTESSKSEAVDLAARDAEGQVPRYSVKKSASFKPVSVTKNFLAKAGSASTPTKASSDKAASLGSSPGPSTLTALRPRLVAKSASGQRDTILKSTSMSDKTGQGSAPDPNQVWNRNRVSTPQATGATPKHLTDEELRQQYGIQLASRPQEDGDDKGAKWADIDDEEDDDWVPETIEWNDGTKINLAQETAAAAAEQQAVKEAAEEQEKQAAARKAAELASKPTTVGPNATVLKLGSSSHQKSSSLSFKGGEKPTLVAKPSSISVKSPWAPIPAVDRMSPVPMNPPTQSTAAKLGQRDVHGFDTTAPPPQSQAKEIAADDFSRFSRDTPNSVPRELFVPQSGRYEPVSESRRQSGRKDSSIRPPSLLQRPSQTDQQGPAQPSAAFQTSRSQHDSGPSWSRRRASSNISGESGKFGRRMSFGKALESPRVNENPSRRGSQFEQSPFAPSMPSARGSQRDASPAQSHVISIASQSPTAPNAPEMSAGAPGAVQPQQDQAQAHPSTVAANAVPLEDPVAVQKRLMREKRDAAIKRKAEEEEREEVGRRERIRIKLEKLGLPPTEEKVGKKDRTEPAALPPNLLAKETKETKNLKEVPGTTPQSPPKPPVPNASGLPQQYGLMKLHGTQTLVTSPSLPRASIDKSLLGLSTVSDANHSRHPDVQMPLINGEPKENHGDTISMPQPDVRNETRSREAAVEPRPWSNVQQAPNSYPHWAGSGMTTHSSPGGNLWGPPANHRALGNGDFQNNLQRASMRSSQPQPLFPQHLTSPPQPIGTPRQNQQSRGLPSSVPNDILTRSIIEDSQTIPAYPSSEPESFSHANHIGSEQSHFRTMNEQTHSQIPLGLVNPMSGTPILDQPKTGTAAWATFSANSNRDERNAAEFSTRDHAARVAEQQINGIVSPASMPTVNETWKQVKRGDSHGTRQVVSHVKSQDIYSSGIQNQPSAEEIYKANNNTGAAPHARSRFGDFFGQDQRAVSAPIMTPRPGTPSAPPPESFDHPAYISVSQRILVNLPGSKPKPSEKPVVKLPPPKESPTMSSSQMVTDARGASSRGPPSIPSPSWQAKFNVLLRKGSSPENRFAVADFSASKEPLEVPLIGGTPTAVTLPSFEGASSQESMNPKSIEEEDALFEERDFGSVPITRIPEKAPPLAWTPAKEPAIHHKRAKAFALADEEVLSIFHFISALNDHSRSASVPISILIPGMSAAKTKMMHRASSHTSSARGGKPHPSRGKFRAGPKSREPSASHGPTKSPQSTPGRSPAQASHVSKPKAPQTPKTNSAWTQRASAVAQ